jgi:hypothetical protein
MGQKNLAFFAVLISLMIIAAIFLAFGLTFFKKEPTLTLPNITSTEATGTTDTESSSDSSITQVAVTPETVQNVIATLTRPTSYFRTMTLTYQSGGNSYVSTAHTWTVSGWTKVDLTVPNKYVKHTIVGNQAFYLWYDQDKTYRKIALSSEDEERDATQHIPTYEDIQKLEKSKITDAGYEVKAGGDGIYHCIYVAENTSLGYQEHYWVSVDNGLLIAYEALKDGAVIYQMTSDSIGTPAGSDTDFSLPDGTLPDGLQSQSG